MHRIKIIIFSVLFCTLLVGSVFSGRITQELQLTSVVNTGSYRLFRDDVYIGRVKNLETLRGALLKKYGQKASTNLYFGETSKIEYDAYSAVVQLDSAEELIDRLDIYVEGVKVTTDTQKEFHVTSYRDWQYSLSKILTYVRQNQSDKAIGKGVMGSVNITENFFYRTEKIPIAQVMDRTELEQKLLFQNEASIKSDTVQTGDTLDTIAQRHNVTKEHLQFANNIPNESQLLEGASLTVSPPEYAIEFSYPVIENVTEDIPYTVEYQDDDTKYVDEEEIIQAGENGRAEAEYLSYVINGISVPGSRLAYRVLLEPTTQIVKKGTKKQTSSSSSSSSSGSSSTSSGADAPYANIAGFIWPAIGLCISAEFLDPTYGYGDHYGFDIAGSSGEEIWAVADGKVEEAGFSGAYGNQIVINHNNGLKTRYAHLKSIGVNPGESVKQGQYIGGMGSTGMSSGVHLHLEVHANGVRVNPRNYLPAGGPKSC